MSLKTCIKILLEVMVLNEVLNGFLEETTSNEEIPQNLNSHI
jgi:hypothetical protein